MSEGQEEYVPTPRELAASNRTNAPGILLSTVGLLNLPLAVAIIFTGIQLFRMSDDEFHSTKHESMEDMRSSLPGLVKMMEQQGDPLPGRTANAWGYLIWGGLSFAAGVLTFYAGFYMRRLESYGMAIAGSVLAALPFLSCSGCCGVGELVGVWAMVVLLSPDVRSEFI